MTPDQKAILIERFTLAVENDRVLSLASDADIYTDVDDEAHLVKKPTGWRTLTVVFREYREP